MKLCSDSRQPSRLIDDDPLRIPPRRPPGSFGEWWDIFLEHYIHLLVKLWFSIIIWRHFYCSNKKIPDDFSRNLTKQHVVNEVLRPQGRVFMWMSCALGLRPLGLGLYVSWFSWSSIKHNIVLIIQDSVNNNKCNNNYYKCLYCSKDKMIYLH